MPQLLLDSPCNAQPPARMVAGALVQLARHMQTGCPRAGHLAAMLLDQVANDLDADTHLRDHARELVDILERDALLNPAAAPVVQARGASTARKPSQKAIAQP